jgi:hypothetical protein
MYVLCFAVLKSGNNVYSSLEGHFRNMLSLLSSVASTNMVILQVNVISVMFIVVRCIVGCRQVFEIICPGINDAFFMYTSKSIASGIALLVLHSEGNIYM